MIGDRAVSGPQYPGSTFGVNLRRGTAGVLMNSITTNFKTWSLKIDDDVTWQFHCAALGQVGGAGPLFKPGVFCSAAAAACRSAQGSVFIANSRRTRSATR